MIDEEISVPRGSDESLLRKLEKNHGPHKQFEKAGAKNCPKEYQRVAFGITHYAGMVMYDTTDFLEKNKDQLHPDARPPARYAPNSLCCSLRCAWSGS